MRPTTEVGKITIAVKRDIFDLGIAGGNRTQFIGVEVLGNSRPCPLEVV